MARTCAPLAKKSASVGFVRPCELMRAGRRLSMAQQWLRNVMAMGRTPIIEVIDPDGVWDTSEAVWIDRLIAAGHPLTNVLSLVPEPRLAFGEVLWSA